MNSEKPAERRPEKAAPLKNHLKVLVMDDEKMIRELASEMLEVLGHTPDSVYGGEEALARYAGAMASHDPYDLVVMDLTIPGGMGGRQDIRELLAIDPAARAVVSSGYSQDPIMANYGEYDFRDVIAKPYSVVDMSRTLAAVVRSG